MYKVSIFNSGVETVIHYPSADNSLPKLLSLHLKESLSRPEELSFSMPLLNLNATINHLTTKVKVFDIRDNAIVFSGRVMPSKDEMSYNGSFLKNVECEGALAYLTDTCTRRWNFTNKTPNQILQYLLDQHNSKVDTERKIYLGIIEITQAITIDTNYETTLNAIITKVRNILGGDIRVQERSGTLYLDYLHAQGENNEVEIRLAYNLKDIVKEYDPKDIITRIIPLGYGQGVNKLGISSVNNGIEYIEDANAINQYGLIEGVINNTEIQDAGTLKQYGMTVLDEKKQIRLTYEQSALDLSVLSGHENEKYELGDTLHTVCSVLNIDVYSRVIERERDLIKEPWNPKLTISTRPIRLTDEIIDLKQRNLSLENAPQGSTCIFPLVKAENADSTHPVEFDLDIPQEAVNINRVYINIHGRKFRADTKDSEAGGVHDHLIFEFAGEPTAVYPDENRDTAGDIIAEGTHRGHAWAEYYFKNEVDEIRSIKFDISQGALETIKTYTASDNHVHPQVYGIFEGTYPKNVKIKVNGQDITGINLGNGTDPFDNYNIDITSKVIKGNNKIQITTEQNGRIDAIVCAQIFIQSK